MTLVPRRRTAPWLVMLAAVSLLAGACASSKPSSPAAPPTASGSWPFPNANLANSRVAPNSTITSHNVTKLRQAWSAYFSGGSVSGYGLLAAGPIVSNGVVYLQDLNANVYALALRTGQLKWEYKVDQPEQSGPGPDGVAVANGIVYGDSSSAAFALSAATGKPVWVERHLLAKGDGYFEIQPQVADGRVYLASAYGLGRGGGVLMALSSATGQLLWKFSSLLAADRGVQSIGAGSGGAWETPLVGADGSVTFGIGNPYQSAASAIADPSPQLYSDSDVNLDAATGKLRWYYQGIPNDFMDHDMQISPIAATINGAPAVLGSGKMGIVYAMNADTGKLIWKTPVGKHSGIDNDGLLAMEHKLTLKAPYTILPGDFGGVLTNMALDSGTVYVATVDYPFKLPTMTAPLGSPVGTGTGEIEALSLATGQVEWDTKVPDMPLGAVTVSNDLVFTVLYTGTLIALNRSTGAIVYQQKLPAGANAPIAIAGNAVLVPVGAPNILGAPAGQPQLVTYTVP
jgi:alcohol dehydrogenase (cytochrome c)